MIFTLLALFSSCSSVVDSFLQQNYGRKYFDDKLKNDFQNGNCKSSFENAERWYSYREKQNPKNNIDRNIVAWLYVTCPNAAERNPDKALQIMQKAKNIAMLTAEQNDTMACAFAAKNNFAEAIKIVRTNQVTDKNPNSTDSREVQFSKKILCLWDGQMPPYEIPVTEEQIERSEYLRKSYLTSLAESKIQIEKKPADVNAAIQACEKNDEQGNLYFCKQELIKLVKQKFELQSVINCKKYEADTVKAKRCYEFYFSGVTGVPNKFMCDSKMCLEFMCAIHPGACK